MSALDRFLAYQAENVGHDNEDARLEWECLMAEMQDDDARIRAENAKLRELVDYMTPIALYGASEQERDRMRELGVDV